MKKEEGPDSDVFSVNSMVYSSGTAGEESDEKGKLGLAYLKMTEEKQDEHIFDLWK
jgi:hypothetical protein